MSTATHPTQLYGAPRRWFLTTDLALPASAIALSTMAAGCAVAAFEFVTPQSRSPLMTQVSAEVISSANRWMLVGVMLVTLAVACTAAAGALRKRAWWSINPVQSDRGAEPAWIGTTVIAVQLTGMAVLLGYIAMRPSLVGAFLLCVSVIAPTVSPLGALFARVIARGAEIRPGAHYRLWRDCAYWAIVASAGAVAWLRGEPLWNYLPIEWVTMLLLPLWALAVASWVTVKVALAGWASPRESCA